MNYDPKDHGADCDNCPLNYDRTTAFLNAEADLQTRIETSICVPEIRKGKTLVIGEAPGKNEVKKGRPFVGMSGKELERALLACGKSRQDVSLSNTLLCMPKGGNLLSYLRKLSKKNKEDAKKAKEAGEEFTPTKNPLDCCYPRLKKEIEAAPNVILLGAYAARQAKGDHGGEEGLKRMRGFQDTLPDGKKCLSTWHPAFVLRSRRWTETFRSDIAKAFRYFENNTTWKAPEIIFDPTLEQAKEALNKLKSAQRWVAIDTETDGLDPDKVNLRCVGLANEYFGIVFGFSSVEEAKRQFKLSNEAAKVLLNDFFASYGMLCGHNVNLYDRPILERHGIKLPEAKNVVDSLILHHISDSEMPHDLDYLSSRHTDAPKHKPTDHESWDSDKDLHVYCGWDCAITSGLIVPLSREVKETQQEEVYWSDIKLQELCRGMHTAGMLIDQDERKRHEIRLRKNVTEAQFKAHELLGKDINLFSHDQVRDYLFYNLKLPLPTFLTDAGDPSTNRDAMYELLQMAIPDKAREFIHILLDARMYGRALAKDVLGLAIYDDGRVHPYWSAHSVVTGRLSCSDPNVQNIPSTKLDSDSLRSMYVAKNGCVLVSCDLEQVELRLVALLSNDAIWLEAFNQELDVHKVNAATFFSCRYEDVEKYQRDYGKTVTYMYLYSGGPNKALIQMRQVRNPVTKERPYANLTLSQAKASRNKLLSDHPTLERWWNKTLDEFKQKFYLEDILLGRRRKFLDSIGNDEDDGRAEIINFRIQSSTAAIMSGKHACGNLIDSIGWGWQGRGLGGAGIINQCHDSMIVEVREDKAEEAKKLLEEAMKFEAEYEGRKIQIPAQAKIGRSWSDV